MSKREEHLVSARVASRACRLKLLRSIVREAAVIAELEEQETENVVLAVNEACMNIIQHAYNDSPDGEIRLSIYLKGESLLFRLEDDAPCTDPASVRPRDLAEIKPGGLGVHFIERIMDEVTFIECKGRGNTLQLVKHLRGCRRPSPAGKTEVSKAE